MTTQIVATTWTCEICQEKIPEGRVHVELGMCLTCRRWRSYGKPCPVCNGVVGMRQVIERELMKEFADLVLITQDALFDHELLVKQSADPRFWMNHTKTQLRQRIDELRGIAARNGIPLPPGTLKALGREVTRNIDGEDWVCLETPSGLVQLHRVEVKVGGDFTCAHCGRAFKVRIAWFKHEEACVQNPTVIARAARG